MNTRPLWDLVSAAISPTERRICDYLLLGFGDNEMATEMEVNAVTVRRHLKDLYRKFEIDPSKCKRVALAMRLWEWSR